MRPRPAAPREGDGLRRGLRGDLLRGASLEADRIDVVARAAGLLERRGAWPSVGAFRASRFSRHCSTAHLRQAPVP